MSSKRLRNLQNTIYPGKLEVHAILGCPESVLNFLTPDYSRGKLTNEEMLKIIDKPVFWAFCKASRQVTVRFLRDNPTVSKHGTVIDFVSGLGVIFIVAALSGSDFLIASDHKANARKAIVENARLNLI